MNRDTKNWQILGKLKKNKSKVGDIIDVLLVNRGLKTEKGKEEFLNPKDPSKISLKTLGVKQNEINKVLARLAKARKNKEKVIVYGDYDADGICASAILWETLYAAKIDALPYIPERFSEGYGINFDSVKVLKEKYSNLGVVATVDNGIVANSQVEEINKLGIDVVITDHHQIGKKSPKSFAIIHTDKIGGAGIAWFLAKEIRDKFKIADRLLINGGGLELAAIGTIADQLPLLGPNRSLAKHGLRYLNETKRAGLTALFKEAGIQKGSIGPYEVGFLIAPRINAMGRLTHAIDSLRLLCIRNSAKANELALHIGRINSKRQRIVDEVVVHAKELALASSKTGVIILAHETYHEGVIGLAAGKLVEEYYRPAIVISKGKEISKASARSISGFNIIEAIRKLDSLLKGGGGHPMAAGFSIATSDIEIFSQKFQEISAPYLTQEILTKKLRIDLEIKLLDISDELNKALQSFEPTGLGNPQPTFLVRDVEISDAKAVGRDGRHLKLKIKGDENYFDAIAFGLGNLYPSLSHETKWDLAFGLEENIWNGSRSLQLKIKDLRISK